jgi:hypothetical protein
LATPAGTSRVAVSREHARSGARPPHGTCARRKLAGLLGICPSRSVRIATAKPNHSSPHRTECVFGAPIPRRGPTSDGIGWVLPEKRPIQVADVTREIADRKRRLAGPKSWTRTAPLHHNKHSALVQGRAGRPPRHASVVGEQMVTIVRRLFGVRAYDNRSYEISSCHIAKVLRNLSTPTRSGSSTQRPTKHDSKHEAGAQQ